MALPSNSSQDCLKILKDRWFQLFIVIPLLLLILPVSLLFLSFMYLVRFSVKLMAKIVRPDLGNIVSCNSAIVTFYKGSLENTQQVIVITGTCDGTLDIQQFKESLRELLQIKNTDGKLQYPELMQFPIIWMGYYFWCWDTNFHLDNHVHLFKSNQSVISKEELNNFKSQLINESFTSAQSPWNVTIVNNISSVEHDHIEQMNTRSSALVLKISHTIGDGYSVVKLVERLCEVTKKDNIKLTYPVMNKGFKEKILYPLKTLSFLGERYGQGTKLYPLNVTKRPLRKNLQISGSVSVDDIKRIKGDLNVNFTSVIFALTAGSIRTLLLKSGSVLTKTIPCLIPILKPGHPSKLRNHFCIATINLPIGEPDPIKRAELCDLEFKNVKSSPETIINSLEWLAFGGCSVPVSRKLRSCQSAPVTLSYLPLDWSQNTLAGCNLNSVSACLTPDGLIGLNLTVVSLRSNLIFSAVFDCEIITEETASGFAKCIQNELDMLKDSDSRSKHVCNNADIV